MANLVSRFILFLSSYLPLWIIFGVLTVREQPYVSATFWVVSALTLLLTLVYLRLARRIQPINMKIGIIRRKDSDTMSYIASYLIPFAATAFDKLEQVASLCIFLIVLCVVYVNTGMIHINPLLSIIGYNLYELEDADGNEYFVISRRCLRRGLELKAIRIAEGIFLEK